MKINIVQNFLGKLNIMLKKAFFLQKRSSFWTLLQCCWSNVEHCS